MTKRLRVLFLAAAAAVSASCSDEPPPRRASPVRAQPSDIEVLHQQLAKDPANADGWFHLSELYERASLYQEQAEALRKVIALRPEMGYAYVKLGTVCNRLQRYDEAVKNFLEAERYVPNQPQLYNNLAFSYGKLGKAREEIAALRKAIAIRPRYAVAHHNLGMALLEKGDLEGARKEVSILREIDEGAAVSLEKEIANAGR